MIIGFLLLVAVASAFLEVLFCRKSRSRFWKIFPLCLSFVLAVFNFILTWVEAFNSEETGWTAVIFAMLFYLFLASFLGDVVGLLLAKGKTRP